MKQLNTYIIEKLVINKDTKLKHTVDEVNEKFISKITEYLSKEYGVKIDKNGVTSRISVGSSKKYIHLFLKYRKDLYKKVMKWIETNLSVSRPCSTNNQYVYIYPKYDESVTFEKFYNALNKCGETDLKLIYKDGDLPVDNEDREIKSIWVEDNKIFYSYYSRIAGYNAIAELNYNWFEESDKEKIYDKLLEF